MKSETYPLAVPPDLLSLLTSELKQRTGKILDGAVGR
jgi:hypothetical protein